MWDVAKSVVHKIITCYDSKHQKNIGFLQIDPMLLHNIQIKEYKTTMEHPMDGTLNVGLGPSTN